MTETEKIPAVGLSGGGRKNKESPTHGLFLGGGIVQDRTGKWRRCEIVCCVGGRKKRQVRTGLMEKSPSPDGLHKRCRGIIRTGKRGS